MNLRRIHYKELAFPNYGLDDSIDLLKKQEENPKKRKNFSKRSSAGRAEDQDLLLNGQDGIAHILHGVAQGVVVRCLLQAHVGLALT